MIAPVTQHLPMGVRGVGILCGSLFEGVCLNSRHPTPGEEERVGAPAQGPFCRDPLDPVDTLDLVDPLDPVDPLAWEKVVFRLSKTIISRQQKQRFGMNKKKQRFLVNIAHPSGAFTMKNNIFWLERHRHSCLLK